MGFALVNFLRGAVAQPGERFNGIEEAEGSSPSSSTTIISPLYIGVFRCRLFCSLIDNVYKNVYKFVIPLF